MWQEAGKQKNMQRIALVGNPNTGKSALFSALTGIYANISNFPGTTTDVQCGYWQNNLLVDGPGVYGISSFSPEEKLVTDLVFAADMVINVVDATHLNRDLFLTLHLLDSGMPLIVALNMMDEAQKNGVQVDLGQLEHCLGVPVVPMMAIEGKGLEPLGQRLREAHPGNLPKEMAEVEKVARLYGIPQGKALLLLEGDLPVAEELGVMPGMKREALYQLRRERVNAIVTAVAKAGKGNDSSLLTRLTINPFTGIPLLLLVLAGIYLVVGVFLAQTVVGFTQETVMEGYYEPWIRSFVAKAVDIESPFGIVLVGQFGLATMSITYLLGLLVPLALGFFLVMSFLEDSGYLPRIALLVDKILSPMGLNGLAVIPLILGFGCVTMASISTRMLQSDKARLITIFLLVLVVPCSAQLAFVTAILGRLGFAYLMLFVVLLLSILVGTGTLLGRFLPGEGQPLLVDLPPLRMPKLSNVARKAWMRAWDFVKDAFPIFLGGALLLSIFQIFGVLKRLERVLEPLTVGWLGLPGESAAVLIMGLIRRDFGTAGLMNLTLQPEQQFVGLVTLTLFVPCLATVAVLFKERGSRGAIMIWSLVIALALCIGGILAHVLAGITVTEANKPWLLIGILLFLWLILSLYKRRGSKS